ncbi:LysR family transcriptional regulator [Thalassotalea sp. LPB0316]|uniref:LysR substrate-binding domain-containing protein n=1 Tax=Thalassotalea sp. LPB0316 TaxID=2769490 RepID=UPI00186620CE|nr:LysR substrate-binding domain-containing protein [Thalassotalea sp. LPB0316]QOL24379.1 LysR family transcriptional regulator [Thalassotalea sp. LPB0316]
MKQYLRNIDLNLLSIFTALMHERNLSHAAENLGMSQPAVSQALKRLRSVYNDPLFERKSGQMMPTLKAMAIAPVIEDMLNNVSLTLPDMHTFDPNKAKLNYKLNITGVENSYFLRQLAVKVAQLAPHASLTISNDVLTHPERALREKEYDLHLDYVPIESEDCYHKILFTDDMYILARKDHPRLAGKSHITLSDFLGETHAVLRPRENNVYPIQYAIKEMTLDREIKYTSSNFDNIVDIVKATDHLCIVPGITIKTLNNQSDYIWFKPPFKLDKTHAYINWHWSVEHLKSNRWIRELVLEVCSEYNPVNLE